MADENVTANEERTDRAAGSEARAVPAGSDVELSEAELDAVAGGAGAVGGAKKAGKTAPGLGSIIQQQLARGRGR